MTGCAPSLLLDLRPNYGGGNDDNGDFLQKIPCVHRCTQGPQPCNRPSPTYASARDSWTLTGKSGSVSYRVTAPFFWVLVPTSRQYINYLRTAVLKYLLQAEYAFLIVSERKYCVKLNKSIRYHSGLSLSWFPVFYP